MIKYIIALFFPVACFGQGISYDTLSLSSVKLFRPVGQVNCLFGILPVDIVISSAEPIQSYTSAQTGVGNAEVYMPAGQNLKINIGVKYPVSGWTNWDPAKPLTVSGLTVSVDKHYSITDNGAGYVDSLAREGSYAAEQRTLSITGLDNAKTYTVGILASRNAAGLRTVLNNKDTVGTYRNSKWIYYTLEPREGKISIPVKGIPYNNYINAVTLSEVIVNHPPVILAKDTTFKFGQENHLFVIRAYDPDGDTLTYSNPVRIYASDSTASIVQGEYGPYVLFNRFASTERYRIAVTDSKGARTEGVFTVNWVYDPEQMWWLYSFGQLGTWGVFVDKTIRRLE